MGSSYRQDLNSGNLKEWEIPLYKALEEIRKIHARIYECCGDDGQFDNAMDDGRLQARLGICIDILEEELNLKKPLPHPVNGGE